MSNVPSSPLGTAVSMLSRGLALAPVYPLVEPTWIPTNPAPAFPTTEYVASTDPSAATSARSRCAQSGSRYVGALTGSTQTASFWMLDKLMVAFVPGVYRTRNVTGEPAATGASIPSSVAVGCV